MESFMFSDGTWVVHRPKQEGLLKPKRELEETFNKRVEVYDIRTWSDTGYRLWLFTSEGLITWKPGREAMTQVKLPKAEGFLPVMVSRVETPVAKKVRFALFPGQGGTTYLLDTSSGEVTLEGLVEEGYPETYWRQRTVASKREELMNAIAAKNLVWPPQVAATTQAAE
jgi:hypothetical protein